MAIGLSRGGVVGAVLAWVGFTLPSAVLMILFAYGMVAFSADGAAGWIHGLKVAAVAVVAQAIWGMGRSLCPDRTRASIAVLAATILTASSSPLAQIGVIILGAAITIGLRWRVESLPHVTLQVRHSRAVGGASLLIWVVMLLLMPILAANSGNYLLNFLAGLYRAGSLVFGGGHVVLPLLQAHVVPNGWVTDSTFLAGYGVAQAVPGPLFSFAAFLGAASSGSSTGWLGGFLALIAIFLPSLLLVVGVLPFWEKLRMITSVQRGMVGANAAVIGLLLAAFYHPVWTAAVLNATDFIVVLAGFVLLEFWRAPPWSVVGGSAVVLQVL